MNQGVGGDGYDLTKCVLCSAETGINTAGFTATSYKEVSPSRGYIPMEARGGLLCPIRTRPTSCTSCTSVHGVGELSS